MLAAGTTVAAPPSGLRILQLEDSATDAELAACVLAKAGLRAVCQQVQTEAGFLAALSPAPDLILADFRLPHFDGLRALRLVRDRGLDTPFIILTGTLGDELAADCMRQGATDYVLKDRLARLGPAVQRALAEVRIRTAHAAAERRIREQADLLNQTSDAIVVTDLDGCITFWNRGAELLAGWTAAEAVGRRFVDLQGPGFGPTVQAVRTAVEKTGAWHQELTLQNKSGQPFTVDLRVSPLRDPSGRPNGRLSIATDITERKKLQEQFLRAQRLENLGLLAAGIAHDLNNILSPIMMVTPLLRGHLTAAEDQRFLDTLEQSARRGAGLVKQILAFAHGSDRTLGAVQVKHLARDISTLIEETFPRSIRFRSYFSPDLWTVSVNPTQIHQLLLNLCVNARDAMPAGGELGLRLSNCTLDEAAAAAIPGGRPGSFVLIEVADTGTGIPPELQERMWEPFFTTKAADKGTGLGLSTVRGIVSRHHGFGTVESTIGRGTTFRFWLPAAASETGPAGSTTPPSPPCPAAAARPSSSWTTRPPSAASSAPRTSAMATAPCWPATARRPSPSSICTRTPSGWSSPTATCPASTAPS